MTAHKRRPVVGADDMAEIARLAAAYEAECTLEQPETKKTACRTLAEEVVRRRRLVVLELAGKLDTERARTIAGMTSNIGRWMKMLGLTDKKSKKATGFLG